jgi:nitroimidazol reductase NimA-like FMN-containing flavoprotein (pyridoxamine 5'-phosphate oxidase superfamily)
MLGELTDTEIDAVLREETLGRIGCHARDMTYVVPVSYVYDGSSVLCLSAEGLKMQLMRENPRVCFEVEQIRHWTNWKSVIAWGTFEELSGQPAEDARQLLQTRLTPLIAFEAKLAESEQPMAPGLSERALLMYRIRLDKRSGRFEHLWS